MGVRFRLSNRMDLVACGTCGRNFNQDALTRHAPICKKNAKKKPRKQFDSQKNRLVGTEVNINDLKRKEKKGLTAKEQRAADRKNNWKAKHEELIRNIRAARGESDPEPSYNQRGGGSGRDRGQSYGGGYGGSYGNDYGAQPSYSSKPSNGYGSSRHNSYNNNNYGYDDSPPARTGYGSSASKIPGPKAVPPGYMNCAHCGRNFAEETAERHIPWCAEQQKRKAVKQGNPETKQSAAQKWLLGLNINHQNQPVNGHQPVVDQVVTVRQALAMVQVVLIRKDIHKNRIPIVILMMTCSVSNNKD